jgi:hypothetical protein
MFYNFVTKQEFHPMDGIKEFTVIEHPAVIRYIGLSCPKGYSEEHLSLLFPIEKLGRVRIVQWYDGYKSGKVELMDLTCTGRRIWKFEIIEDFLILRSTY